MRRLEISARERRRSTEQRLSSPKEDRPRYSGPHLGSVLSSKEKGVVGWQGRLWALNKLQVLLAWTFAAYVGDLPRNDEAHGHDCARLRGTVGSRDVVHPQSNAQRSCLKISGQAVSAYLACIRPRFTTLAPAAWQKPDLQPARHEIPHRPHVVSFRGHPHLFIAYTCSVSRR